MTIELDDLKRQAEQGDADAQHALGLQFLTGASQDLEKADELFRKGVKAKQKQTEGIYRYVIKKNQPPRFLFFEARLRRKGETNLVGLDVILGDMPMVLISSVRQTRCLEMDDFAEMATQIFYWMQFKGLALDARKILWLNCFVDRNVSWPKIGKEVFVPMLDDERLEMVILDWKKCHYDMLDSKPMKLGDSPFDLSFLSNDK